MAEIPKTGEGGSVISPDVVPPRPDHDARMSSYAVFWRSTGIAFHGQLELDPQGLWLRGGEQGHELRVEVPYDEIVNIERNGEDRIGPCPAIRVQSRAGGSLLIASIAGVGTLSEIFASLKQHTLTG